MTAHHHTLGTVQPGTASRQRQAGARARVGPGRQRSLGTGDEWAVTIRTWGRPCVWVRYMDSSCYRYRSYVRTIPSRVLFSSPSPSPTLSLVLVQLVPLHTRHTWQHCAVNYIASRPGMRTRCETERSCNADMGQWDLARLGSASERITRLGGFWAASGLSCIEIDWKHAT